MKTKLPIIIGAFAIMQFAANAIEQRNSVSYLRGPYNTAFFHRENESFMNSAAIHFAHAIQHDILQLTPLSDHERVDAETDARYVDFLLNHKAKTEPTMEYYGPYTARAAWKVYRAIDWTHMHHEQTYDIIADRDIPWDRKKHWTDRAVKYYLEKNPVARSCAPLDVTMRRAGVMMKPYFGYFRNKYPKSNNFFYVAHWWHPAIYEAQMIGGNDQEQEQVVHQTDETMYHQVLKDRPLRMLLSREMMPRYSRLSPESANIFDNLHMLHGIVYDIMAYEGWTIEEKRKELYRVVEAMSYQPGDEKLARKFSLPHPEIDPRSYEEWMRGTEGEMNRIMMEMHEEMMPLMMPEGKKMSPDMHEKMTEAMRKKLKPGMQEGEVKGSLHDAMMKLMPDMKMDKEGMKPGNTPKKMVEAMLQGWRKKYEHMPDVKPMPMNTEPNAPALRTVLNRPSEFRQTPGEMKEASGASKNLPSVPPPNAAEAKVPEGYKVEVMMKNLTYPTSVEFDDQGNMFIAEAGYSYGDDSATPRILRVSPSGSIDVVAKEKLNGPINDLLWHKGQMFISHRGKISVLEGGKVRDLVTGLPSEGDHHNNQMSVGPDGKIYFGQGTASNSGVIGKDNFEMGWLKKHPEFHDIPARDIQLRGQTFSSESVLSSSDKPAKTAAFHPFGETAETKTVQGQTKASGTILRMNADGSGLEVYAWGLRNPYGLMWSDDGKLYASENGFDVRGSRPIANDKEDLYVIKEGAWYGWPDFASGIPVTDPQFRAEGKPAPEFLIAEHPPVEKPLLTFPKHSAVTKISFSPGEKFGFKGELFLAFFGHMSPMTGKVEEHGGHRIVRINPETRQVETFFSKKEHHQMASDEKSANEPAGAEHPHAKKSGHAKQNGEGGHKEESITAGPRRLMETQFSPQGDALYVVDFGSMTVDKKAHPIRETGVIWRVTKQETKVVEPPANLSAPQMAR